MHNFSEFLENMDMEEIESESSIGLDSISSRLKLSEKEKKELYGAMYGMTIVVLGQYHDWLQREPLKP